MALSQNRPRINRLLPLSPAPSGVSTSISLLEQAIFVNASLSSPSVLRGRVELCVSKPVQIRDVTIKFRGVNKLLKFGPFGNEDCIIDRTWLVPHLEARSDDTTRLLEPRESPGGQRLWPVLKPGQYAYDFELNLNQKLPASFNIGGCTLKYTLQATASIAGLRRQVSQSQEVVVVHSKQDELYLHDANQISLSRIWNKQIYYNIEVSDKSAPIGGKVPIAVRIGCSDILYIALQVYLGQKIKFPGIPGKQPQLRKRLLLKSKCTDLSTGKFNEDNPGLSLDRDSGTTIIVGDLPLQDEHNSSLKLHPDVNFNKVKATHSILFLIDLTIQNSSSAKPDKTVCRLTAETPFTLRSSRMQIYDLSVPQYTENHDFCQTIMPDDSLPPPPFSPFPTEQPGQLQPYNSSDSLTDGDYPELTRSAFSSSTSSSSSASFVFSCRTDSSASETDLCPPPAYDSIQ